MSNYTLESPVDVTSTGYINLFSTGSSNAVQLQSPSLTSNIPFVLPSTSGSTGQYLSKGISGTQWSSPPGNTTMYPLNFLVTGPTSDTPARTNSNTALVVSTIYFQGTSTETPTAIYNRRIRKFDCPAYCRYYRYF